MKDFKVRYLVNYTGPSYGGAWAPESMQAVSSIGHAKQLMRDWQRGSIDSVEFVINDDQSWVYAGSSSYRTPATTDQDRMDLHPVLEQGLFGSLVVAWDASHRLTVGALGGIIVERY